MFSRKKLAIFVLIVGLSFGIAMPLAHAGFLDWVQEMATATGFAATASFNATAQIGNSAPVCSPANMTAYGGTTITEAANTKVYYLRFNVTDADGFDAIDEGTANVNLTLAGHPTIYNMSCVNGSDINTTTITVTCGITFNYSATPGAYTVTVGMADSSGSVCTDNTDSTTLATTTSLTSNVTALTFPSVGVSATDTLANNDPILLNNTGNKNVTSNNVKINATDLRGVTTCAAASCDQIGAQNFTANTANACTTGTALVNMTVTGITSTTLYIGQPGTTNATEELYICLEDMLDTISIQGYSTNYTATNYWIISVA